MEENNAKGDLHGNVARQLSVRNSGSLKPSLSGRSSPMNSTPLRRLHSGRTPKRESKTFSSEFHWIRNNRVVLWLMLITLWAYIGFHVQSQWAHSDHRKAEFVGYKNEVRSADNLIKDARKLTDAQEKNATTSTGQEEVVVPLKGEDSDSKKLDPSLARKGRQVSSKQNATRKSSRRSERRRRKLPDKPRGMALENRTGELEEGLIPRRNTSYGLIVGPFGKTEDSILGWNADKRRGTCDRKGEFSHIVWSRSFVLIFHELSMTGAPLSMMELATEILSCGGRVSVVVLSRKGGLLTELDKRGIKVLKDRAQFSFKAAMKADLIVAGSAVCSSWIEQYLVHFPAGSSQIVWWIMENRREYFERSKHMLSQVKMLIFLSHLQSKQWISWCEEEKIHLNLHPMVVPLSVNDELAFVAGIRCSLNTLAFNVEKMLEKRALLRADVRKEMGLGDNDMLVMSLSSINPTKGQRLFLDSALLVAEHNVSLYGFENNDSSKVKRLSDVSHQNETTMNTELNPGAIPVTTYQGVPSEGNGLQNNGTTMISKKRRRKHSRLSKPLFLGNHTSKNLAVGDGKRSRNLMSENEAQQDQSFKILIGSIGSKSNKVLYVKAILRFLSQHPSLSKLVLWTQATRHVASLYAAADVYVINAQGFGETFGRVTVEAMAFGLPVLGTDAGGTQEIVENGVTGLLHPVGRQGIEVLAQNIQYLMANPSVREKMGMQGRQKVQEKYLKKHMYKQFAEVLSQCMKIK